MCVSLCVCVNVCRCTHHLNNIPTSKHKAQLKKSCMQCLHNLGGFGTGFKIKVLKVIPVSVSVSFIKSPIKGKEDLDSKKEDIKTIHKRKQKEQLD